MRAILIALLASVSTTFGGSTEIWVVNEGSRDITVIDAAMEQVAATISLQDRPQQPYGVAFSTISGFVGRYAFVTQGPFIRVVDAATRTVVRTVDVSTFLGMPAVLRGCSAARPRDFLDTSGQPAIKSYLHVAAQVQAVSVSEPWFIVLDQHALAIAPAGTPPIVGAGSLMGGSPGVVREAMDVAVLGTEHGSLFQRCWYTFRETSPTPTIFAVLVARPRQLGLVWSVQRYRQQSFSTGTVLPDSIAVDAPFSRELPGLPLGPLGRLVNLDTDGFCDVGGIPRSVAIAGPGPGSYTVLVADKVGDGVSGLLLRVDGQTCGRQSFVVGQDPVDVVTLDPIDWKKAFVPNRASDSVTVVHASGPSSTILLDMMPGPCARCPRSGARRPFPEIGCTIQDLDVDRSGNDTILSWAPVGCDAGIGYAIWCNCEDPADCPPGCCRCPDPFDCSPVCTPARIGGEGNATTSFGSFEGDPQPVCGGDWKPLGHTEDTTYSHVSGALHSGLSYSIEPDDR